MHKGVDDAFTGQFVDPRVRNFSLSTTAVNGIGQFVFEPLERLLWNKQHRAIKIMNLFRAPRKINKALDSGVISFMIG